MNTGEEMKFSSEDQAEAPGSGMTCSRYSSFVCVFLRGRLRREWGPVRYLKWVGSRVQGRQEFK